MRLNRVEKAMMNNPVRAAAQRYLEVPRLLALGGRVDDGPVLEVGCGRGVGTALILEHFGVSRVDAFDLDPDMAARARRRLARFGNRVRVFTGDASRIAAPDARYAAVFDFGIIHHLPDWRRAVAEVHRVLRPGGRLYAEEIFARFILHPVVRRLLEHPLEDRFDHDGFRDALEQQGFRVDGSRDVLGLGGFFVATRA